MLAQHEVYRRICTVDIGPVLGVLSKLNFIRVGHSRGMYPCDVCLRAHFPAEVEALVDSLPLGGDRARVIIRRLGARQSIPPHIDDWMPDKENWRRFQIPIVTNHGIMMRWPDDDVMIHLEAGYLWEVRFDRMHEVINEFDGDRIDIQIDQVGAVI